MDPNTTMVAAPSILSNRSNGHSTHERRPVRRDPEKRRQQNVQAQKKYREKVKKRLDDLETLTAALAESTGVAMAATDDASPSVAPIPQSGPSNSTTTERQSSCHHVGQSLTSIDHSGESSACFSDLDLSASISLTPLSDVTLWDPTISMDPSHFIHTEDTASSSSYWAGLVDCGCLRPHVQISSPGPRGYRDLQVLNVSLSPPVFGANPYANTLRVERLCIAQALFSNCLHIGITENMFCDDEAVSPFFRPGGDTVDDSDSNSVVRTMQGIFKTLKPDVRPTREQITYMHAPFIDVLPFPTLRRNLIKNGDAVDGDELCDDLLNGLVCWGGAGVGKRDRDCSTGSVSTGTPWDSRSWEARTWFLQKYWTLLGGEDGELVRQSEWWRNMRGEDIDVWSGL